jgi:hypothetical protein
MKKHHYLIEREKDEEASLDRRLDKLRMWYRRRLDEQKRTDLLRRAQQVSAQIEREGLLRTHILTVEQILTDHESTIQNLNLNIPGTELPDAPSTGTGGTTTGGLPPGAVAGAPCSQKNPNQGYIGADGQPYLCINGRWTSPSAAGLPTQGPTATGNGAVGLGSASAPLGTQQVTITTNDPTLSAILNEMTYDAVIDVVGED